MDLKEEELTKEDKEILEKDILDRYNNSEYWNLDILIR